MTNLTGAANVYRRKRNHQRSKGERAVDPCRPPPIPPEALQMLAQRERRLVERQRGRVDGRPETALVEQVLHQPVAYLLREIGQRQRRKRGPVSGIRSLIAGTPAGTNNPLGSS